MLGLAVIGFVFIVRGLWSMTASEWSTLDLKARDQLISGGPAKDLWRRVFDWSANLLILGDGLTILMNSRRRSASDFIAGTMVLKDG